MSWARLFVSGPARSDRCVELLSPSRLTSSAQSVETLLVWPCATASASWRLAGANRRALALIDGPIRVPSTSETSDEVHLAIARNRDAYYDEARATAPRVGYLVERRRLLRDLLARLDQATYDEARALFATVHQCYLRRLQRQRFDCVVIDEASMVSVDLSLIAAGLSDSRVVIGGDFRQLGPIRQSEALSARPWLGDSIFERVGIPNEVTRQAPRNNLVPLRLQYRMRPEIAEVVASLTYPENGLESDQSIRLRPIAGRVAATDASVVLIDTSDLDPWMARARGTRSRYNPIHAQVIQSLVHDVSSDTSIGLISPFAPQASLLRSVIRTDDERAAASTVHRFQGGERDVIVWDSTWASGGRASKAPWFRDTRPWEEGSRLTNVAISRAKEQLVVVANLRCLTEQFPPDSTVRRVLKNLQQSGVTVSSRAVLTGRDLPSKSAMNPKGASY